MHGWTARIEPPKSLKGNDIQTEPNETIEGYNDES